MPFYRVSVGYGIADTACAYILANGISPTIYPVPVRVVNFYKAGSDQTVFEIQAGDDAIAREWNKALIQAIGEFEEYIPAVPENPDAPPTALNVWARVGTWSKTVGNATTTVSGLPGAPKGIIVWGTGLSGQTMNSYPDGVGAGCVFGFSNGAVDRDLAYVTQDNVNPTNANRSMRDKAFHLVDPNLDWYYHYANVDENCTITFGSTSFDMNWNATTLATTGCYFVFGGSDISLVEIKDYLSGTTTANDEVTYMDLAARHDFAIFLNPYVTSSTWTSAGLDAAINSVSVHAGADNAKSWCSNIACGDASVIPEKTWSLQRTNRLLHTMSPGDKLEAQAAEWAGWTNEGFKLNWIDPPTWNNMIFTGMFVKGGNWDVGSFVQPATTGDVTTLTSPATSTMQGIMAFSNGKIDWSNQAVGNGIAKWAVGGADSTGNARCLSYSSSIQTSGTPTWEQSGLSNTKFMRHMSAINATTLSAGAECTVTNMATPGEFTLNYTVVDGGTLRHSVWFCLSS